MEPRPSDSPLIERVWRTQDEGTGTFLSQAKTCGMIVLSHYEGKTLVTVRGPETKAMAMDYTSTGAKFVGIEFKLGVFMPLFPPRKLLNQQDVNLPEASSQSFWLQGSAWQFPTYENADTFANRLIREGLLVHDPVVDAIVQGHPHDMALRTAQYRFARATGLSHQTVQLLERIQYAANLLARGVSILDTVEQAGYFDQPHLTRSMKRFLGETPAQIAGVKRPE
ncbi:MAG: AraC family transcriptional regulator [Anaerolineae bacterium]|nr:AraC family transcriptional regulator [Anaerolineae bacterium]